MTSGGMVRRKGVVGILGAACLLGAAVLSGCSGGSQSQISSVTTSTGTAGTGGVSASVTASGSSPKATVTWSAPASLPSGATLLEYHVYRDGAIVGATPVGTSTFTDDSTTGTFLYNAYDINDAHLLDMVKGTHTALTGGVTHLYRVTYLYSANDANATVQPTLIYSEASVGVSNAVTP